MHYLSPLLLDSYIFTERTKGEEHREPLSCSRVHIIHLPVQLLHCNDTTHRSLSQPRRKESFLISLSLPLSNLYSSDKCQLDSPITITVTTFSLLPVTLSKSQHTHTHKAPYTYLTATSRHRHLTSYFNTSFHRSLEL